MRTLAWIALVAAAGAQAQDQPGSPPERLQRGGVYVEPPATVDRVYTPLGPDQPDPGPWQEPRVTLRLTLDLPLRSSSAAGAGVQGTRPGSPTAQAMLRWRPLADRAWFVQGTAYEYLRHGRQRSWDPDFSYAFGYDDGQPGHWAFIYSNYTGTRWPSRGGQGGDRLNFAQGQWTASYRFDLPASLQPWLLRGDDDAATCHADVGVVPRFTRADAGTGSAKTSLALGCRYTRPDGWFAHATALAWPGGDKQQPWDPDFVYGLGWTRPGDPHGLTIQYANYSGNRWGGRARAPDEGLVRSGSLSVGWGTAW